METRIDGIGADIYRISTFVPHIAAPAGFTFNQFLVLGDEPLLFHTGLRRMFPSVHAAISRIMPPDRLRWICFGHYEADECGAMNEWLAVAPRAEVAHGQTACLVSLNDMADRQPRILVDGEVIDLGAGKRVRYLDTPHVPHGWEAGVFTKRQAAPCSAAICSPKLTSGDIVTPAIAAEDVFRYSSLSLNMGPTIRRLGDLSPRTLALMHGPSFTGDGTAMLHALADDYDRRVRDALT